MVRTRVSSNKLEVIPFPDFTLREEIAEAEEVNINKFKESLEKMKPGSGGLNPQQMWKLRNKLCPKSRDPPSAMLDSNGNLLVSDQQIKGEALNEYRKVWNPTR